MGKKGAAAKSYKVTLAGGRVFVINGFTVKLKNQAVQSAAAKCPSDAPESVFQSLVGDEALKLSLASIDGKAIDAVEREDLDQILEFDEYQALNGVMGELLGSQSKKKAKVELIANG